MEWKKYTITTSEEAVSMLRSRTEGLESAEADRRLLEYGRNTVEEEDSFFWRIVNKRIRSLLSWVFLLAVIATFVSGNTLESLCILLFLFVNAGIEMYQQFHSDEAARVLRQYLISTVQVQRGGITQEVPASALVPGDILFLEKGDIVPADVRFLETKNLFVKELSVKGDREKIAKHGDQLSVSPLTLADAENMGFAGTSIVEGWAKALVVATGARTVFGDIASQNTHTEKETNFEKNITNLSNFLAKLLLFGLLVIFALYFLIHGEQASMSDMVVFTLVLAIAVVPEALPALTTLALARGSIALTKKGLVAKRLSAIEDLGSVELLCIDKTGILTKNKLTVTNLVSDEPQELLTMALLAVHDIPSGEAAENFKDPFDKALWQKAEKSVKQAVLQVTRLENKAFSPETRLQRVVVQMGNQKKALLRGAPEEILRRVERLDSFSRRKILESIAEAGYRGERVLAVAGKTLTEGATGLHDEGGFTFQGLITFLDPIKPSIKEELLLAKNLGVKIKVFSGDSKEVVGAAAYAAGIITDRSAVLIGDRFEEFSLPEKIHALEQYSVFARFSPTQEKDAVSLLQKNHVVGMFGSNISDIPTLQKAQVALVSSEAGDMTKESSDILVLENDLKVLIRGIQESRKVFANILKYVKITLASNFGNFYAVTLAALFLPYLPLLPLQILFLNLLSDIPMFAIATDSVDQEKLERPKDQSLHFIIVTATLFGMISSFFDLTIFKIFSEYSPSVVQTVWFVFSVLTEVLLLYSLRSRRWFFRAEQPSWSVSLLSLLAVVIALAVPYTTVGLFLGFEKLVADIWIFMIVVALGYFAVTEIIKRWYYLHSAFFVTKGRIS